MLSFRDYLLSEAKPRSRQRALQIGARVAAYHRKKFGDLHGWPAIHNPKADETVWDKPIGDRYWSDNKEPETQRVKIKDITPAQSYTFFTPTGAVEYALRQRGLQKKATIIKAPDGKLYQFDGHHWVLWNRLLGNTEVDAEVYDFSKPHK